MLDKTKVVPFEGTKEQEQELLATIVEYKDRKGAMMPILQKDQGIYGYLPIEVQKMISDGTGIPLEKIYGVVTFYSQFSLTPIGKYKISVCLGTACYVKGAGELFGMFERQLGIKGGETTDDRKFTLEGCRCIGACGLAPVLTINEDVHGRLDVTNKVVEDILAQYE
jgi:NADP-reducing hydrogenase subunit HndA